MWCPYLVIPRGDVLSMNTRGFSQVTYSFAMSRTQIDIDHGLLRKAHELAGLTSKRELVHRALELLVCFETRKSMIQYYGSGVWEL
jgi:Arc/MetJ family transcription regulator